MDLYCLKGKSGNMLSFKKSSDPDFLNSNILVHKLDLLLKEQLEQRKDLSVIHVLLKQLIADTGVQKQVDQYFDEKNGEIPPLEDDKEPD